MIWGSILSETLSGGCPYRCKFLLEKAFQSTWRSAHTSWNLKAAYLGEWHILIPKFGGTTLWRQRRKGGSVCLLEPRVGAPLGWGVGVSVPS